YAAMVENLDANVGRLLEALERLGLTDHTAVVFTSDNGSTLDSAPNTPLRSGKGTLYEGGIRVPLIVQWPGPVPPGMVSDEPVMGCDLYPTLVAMAGEGTRPGSPLDGMDLASLWNGTERLDRDALYWYYPHYARDRPGAAVRRRNLKL